MRSWTTRKNLTLDSQVVPILNTIIKESDQVLGLELRQIQQYFTKPINKLAYKYRSALPVH